MITFLVLGNPGEKYKETRHNAGRVVFDAVIEDLGLPKLVDSSKYGGLVSEGVVQGHEVLVVYPGTYMNNSGEVAKKVVDPKELDKLVVVYDDIDIPLGESKLSFGRGAGGHNGLASVIDAMGGKDFWRIRVGIAPKSLFGKTIRPSGHKLQRYVLGSLSKREQAKLQTIKDDVMDMIKQIIANHK